jgi:hypothetical protein
MDFHTSRSYLLAGGGDPFGRRAPVSRLKLTPETAPLFRCYRPTIKRTLHFESDSHKSHAEGEQNSTPKRSRHSFPAQCHVMFVIVPLSKVPERVVILLKSFN